jgi:hypothetical protein
MRLAICPGGGRARGLFRSIGNLGRPRSFQASFALAGLDSNTILAQRVQTGLSTAPTNASTSWADEIFSTPT